MHRCSAYEPTALIGLVLQRSDTGVGAHVGSKTPVAATGVSIDGTREVLGTAVGDSESFEFWREFVQASRPAVCRGCIWWFPMRILG